MARAQLTITLSPDLGQYIEERSTELGVKKSDVVARALEADRDRHIDELLRKGYQELAEHDKELLREFEHVDRETPWPEYAKGS